MRRTLSLLVIVAVVVLLSLLIRLPSPVVVATASPAVPQPVTIVVVLPTAQPATATAAVQPTAAPTAEPPVVVEPPAPPAAPPQGVSQEKDPDPDGRWLRAGAKATAEIGKVVNIRDYGEYTVSDPVTRRILDGVGDVSPLERIAISRISGTGR